MFSRNGQAVPFAAARREVVEAVLSARRGTLANDWIAGLRRRADVVDLYEIKN